MQKINVLGIHFDNVTKKEATDLAFSYIENGTQALAVTPNAEILELCLEKPNVKKAVLSAQIILPDGEGALWAAKKLGTPLREKVAGVEFGEEIARRAAECSKSLFLLGGKAGVAEEAAKKLTSRFPTLKIAGVHDGYFNREGEENAHIIAKINESGADILFVCLGAPAQEQWACENRGALTAPKLIACLGGSLDIYAGKTHRAPKLFIKLRAEWLYRLLREPRRIVRMVRLPKFIKSVKKHIKLQNEV
ncbi:MAG: WecB/TagA/CpsF family glycosyltransferase [Clostridia bacterium]|nr:WecB/TagA/CpsF family glycosyltransferase [Clostridia bacterium]